MVGEQPGTWTVSRSESRASSAALLRRSSTLPYAGRGETGGESDATVKKNADASAEKRRRRLRRGGTTEANARTLAQFSVARAAGRASHCAAPLRRTVRRLILLFFHPR